MLGTIANVATIALSLVAVAFAVRTWLVDMLLRYIGDKNQTWPIAADVLFYNAQVRRESGSTLGDAEVQVEILIRPRFGTWSDRRHPRISTAKMVMYVGGKAHDRKFTVESSPGTNQVPKDVEYAHNILLRHLEKDILGYRLPQGGHAHFEFEVEYPPHRPRRCITEDLLVPKLEDGQSDALSSGDRTWKLKKWGIRGLKTKQIGP